MASSNVEEAKEEMEKARGDVINCEREIQSIKKLLRELGSEESKASASAEDGGGDASQQNSLEIVALKVDGLTPEEQQQLTLKVQLSSPVEEKTLEKDNDDDSDLPSAIFNEVEISNATLVVTATDSHNKKEIGSSKPYEVSEMCTLNPINILDQKEYISEIDVPIVTSTSTSEATTVEETKAAATTTATKTDSEETEESKETETEEEESADFIGDVNDTATSTTPPLSCTIKFRITYKPSLKDKKEKLYEMLNNTSKKKSTAMTKLRECATAVSRAAPPPPPSASSSKDDPAVKSGFLNKKSKDVATKKNGPFTKIIQNYTNYFGPESILRKAIIPIAKNYVLFFGFVTFFHYKGQMLALPPPV